ncbi:MAG: hypothetical protein E2591_03990 [Achromobacter sp.]|uniref:hypothetical protein n=1 Tax=Achromobacter sp. TaxID=134375 RepID=UPI0012BDF6E8|nr:hypothetical protein [Achromobacter sp.]
MDNVDFLEINAPVGYERRLVVFFDVLGWKSQVDQAGSDPERLTRLALLPRLLTHSIVGAMSAKGERKMTSFSDCAVVSTPFDDGDIVRVLQGLCSVVAGAAVNGFFLRAGVTVGDLCHDNRMVFGPGLNRAHHLESTGKYPRIVLDDEIDSFRSLRIDGLCEEDGVLFVDAYLLSNFENAIRSSMYPSPIDAHFLYEQVILLVRKELDQAQSSSVREKFEWLHSRMCAHYAVAKGRR